MIHQSLVRFEAFGSIRFAIYFSLKFRFIMLLSHLSKYPCEYEKFKFAAQSLETDAIGQANFIHYECLRMFYDPSKSFLQMLKNTVASLTNVL